MFSYCSINDRTPTNPNQNQTNQNQQTSQEQDVLDGSVLNLRSEDETKDYSSKFRRDIKTFDACIKNVNISEEIDESDSSSKTRVPCNSFKNKNVKKNEDDEEESGFVIKDVKSIAEISDEDIRKAVLETGIDFSLTKEAIIDLHEAILTDENSIIRDTIQYARTQQALKRKSCEQVASLTFTLKYQFTNEEKTFLIEEYPEYQLSFEPGKGHEHGVAAAARLLEGLLSKRSFGSVKVPFIDVGGNPLVYVPKGDAGVHCCSPKIDLKDFGRHSARDGQVLSEINRLEHENNVRLMKGCTDQNRQFQRTQHRINVLQRFITDRSHFTCDSRAEECEFEALYGISVHSAYDIPMDMWPIIMMKHKMRTMRGSMLFSDNVRFDRIGEFKEMNVRYERRIESGKKNLFFL